MSAHEIKDRVQAAYLKAMASRSSQQARPGGIDHLFKDLRLYGREAGVDFVRTHLDDIVEQAVDCAECKSGSMGLTTNGWGLAAREGMAEAIRDLSGLQAEVPRSGVIVTWGGVETKLV